MGDRGGRPVWSRGKGDFTGKGVYQGAGLVLRSVRDGWGRLWWAVGARRCLLRGLGRLYERSLVRKVGPATYC